ncbi:30S ribosomal protein S13 [Candidatus Kaiserbacteria bacterium RIFCSPHIGHO2_12_FULL_53_13]|uniref:Small ribosomal subunit protein uS13 n=1 Tax=Candidatus Kaiserbacteria bacterium RIFCSPHIGHO2_12_FULL_53_13 TaxID=1798502 RepID=A0A1F6E7G9_9BACT|nr:MAG: 30S ribosomal protein S13 [Candidatus Kaiserbacteria bacterium RIFCSPHIGHO2_12_FULL_53_13]OGG74441.1 MAG: 30S ribosomal protein S13 [Candidatus Kaiserbacteria bacterium RIFCSPLOWO2_01_FULL_52_36]
MLRISGVTVPESKRLAIGLTSIYGVGRPRALSTLSALGIDAGKRPKDLSAKEETALREAVEKFTLEGELKRQISGNIRRLKDIKSYRGSRHAKHLPVRGQRTKTNSRTSRGNVRKTMTSGRRKLEKT